MKKIVSILTIYLIFASALFTSCQNTKLSNEEAKDIVIKTLSLPQRYFEEINANSMDPLGAGSKCQKLEREGFVYKTGNWIYGYTLNVTDKGKPYVIGQGKDAMYGKSTLKFQAFDLAFDQITGIAINNEQETATVRFTLKAINISPISRALDSNIDNPKNGQFVFKKFNNGWQLEANQGQTSIELLNIILHGER
ncbi:MAG: hypothetical protein C0397_09875 [Odoribacter sp.]|nr:hypothetical protein [Odoribacter sp.]